jgi:SHS2 domain-containing protein
MGYEFLEHTADIKILVEEPNLDEAFKTSAMALKQVMAENVQVKSKITRIISVEGKDLQDLLYSFLEEFIFLLDADDFLLSEVIDLEVNKDQEKNVYVLSATIIGDSASNYRFSNNVKAVTFNDMKIEEDKENNNCVIQLVLDV